MTTRLSVNLNKVALIRNARPLDIPSVTRMAVLALEAGAAGITVHPRPDARHIREQDVHDLSALMKSYPGREFNIEGNPFHNVLPLAEAVRPDQCTLVPDEEGASTSDHGWDLSRDADRLRVCIQRLHAVGVRVSLFMDPEPAAMAKAREIGADRVELYTEPYASSFGKEGNAAILARYTAAAAAARAAGLGVNAGHDLSCANLPPFLRAVPGVLEVSIGHALTADALELGMAGAVRAFLAAIEAGTP